MPNPIGPSRVPSAAIATVADGLLRQGLETSQTAFGNVQLVDWNSGTLTIKAHSGFGAEFLSFFARVRLDDSSACARALRNRETVVIADIMMDEEFAPCRCVVGNQGIRAVQSTPMLSSAGALIGILSTHFERPHRPTATQLEGLTRMAQAAANAIVQLRTPQSDRIRNSVKLIENSRIALERADRVLARTWI